MKIETIFLWSERWSFARGWQWEIERECFIDTSEQWLKIFQDDEPDVNFKLSKIKPKLSKNRVK